MSLADLVISAVVLCGATYLLYRSVWKGKGSCHGCTSSGCRPPRDQAELVRLGGPRRSADPTSPSGVAAARMPDGPPPAR